MSKDVPKSSHIRSFTILSDLSATDFYQQAVTAATASLVDNEAELDHKVDAARNVLVVKLKPEVSKDVPESSHIRSFTILSDLSAAGPQCPSLSCDGLEVLDIGLFQLLRAMFEGNLRRNRRCEASVVSASPSYMRLISVRSSSERPH